MFELRLFSAEKGQCERQSNFEERTRLFLPAAPSDFPSSSAAPSLHTSLISDPMEQKEKGILEWHPSFLPSLGSCVPFPPSLSSALLITSIYFPAGVKPDEMPENHSPFNLPNWCSLTSLPFLSRHVGTGERIAA